MVAKEVSCRCSLDYHYPKGCIQRILSQFNLNISESNKKEQSGMTQSRDAGDNPCQWHPFLSSYFQSQQDSSLVARCTHRQGDGERPARPCQAGARCRVNASFHGCGRCLGDLEHSDSEKASRLLCSGGISRGRGVLRVPV